MEVLLLPQQEKGQFFEKRWWDAKSKMFSLYTNRRLATVLKWVICILTLKENYEGNLESKERFAIKKYLLIIGKKKNMMQVLSHTFTYFST